MAAIVEPVPLLASEQDNDENLQHDTIDPTPTLEKRSKSEIFIRTAQGVLFTDTKSLKKRTRLESLVELAANPGTSRSNALLAQKALRYRKVQGCRRAYN
ncbi:hypothetical protein PHYBOEH_006360 [Phytophthora boehmeriae]|uniref:Uncharacterized protein n=1 Tax=Phytophthora boehmeriae TaxID=109152 RepID=A0A8T1WGV5_9STRA|nr:hypothetical protein PHYBOEH_006360 [Phytophthora boehmeriae]